MSVSRSSMTLARMLPAIVAFGPVVLDSGAAHAQSFKFEYAAKFVCGLAVSPAGGTLPVAPGFYYTAANVHNLTNNDANSLRKKFAVALPGEKVGPISGFTAQTLKSDEAMEIDCPDILQHLGMKPGQFAKGFVVIQSMLELDIVAVYTAATSATGSVVAMTLERVPKRP